MKEKIKINEVYCQWSWQVASRIALLDLSWKVVSQVLFDNTYIWNRQSLVGYDDDAFVFNLNEFGNSS